MAVRRLSISGLALLLTIPATLFARTNVVIIRSKDAEAKSDYRFRVVPPPSATDAATNAKFAIVDGRRDENGAEISALHDGKMPTDSDQPAANFFFAPDTEGGRLSVDLGKTIAVDQVNTYSWHPGSRGPQVYKLYVSDGEAERFQLAPKRGVDPKDFGWAFVATVDTRPSENNTGGKYGVSIFDSDGPIGNFRYLLFDIASADANDDFGNTFYSEIDVVSKDASLPAPSERVFTFKTDAGQTFKIDARTAPDLAEWAEHELAPVVSKWYPKIVEMLPSEDFTAPDTFEITISRSFRGVAATRGTSIDCSASWFRQNLKGEAKGAVVHELVHVVQQYNWARSGRGNRQTPGWLVEGIPDYIRWFLYEPRSRGAEIGPNNASRVKYDDSYRISGNFLNWVVEYHDPEIVRQLNAALRDGKYTDSIWKDRTGKTIEELAAGWKNHLEHPALTQAAAPAAENGNGPGGNGNGVAAASADAHSMLTDEEKSQGWRLLFNGKDFTDWHNFHSDKVKPGWQVQDGALMCADPSNAGDLCTKDEFDWFELKLEYNISAGGNSGIMYRVTDDGNFPWESGPEFQLEDNAAAHDAVRCGWLYALYQPPNDPKTGKPLDATKPAGEWNQVRLVISPERCVHEINGVKYFDYVLGSDEFKDRVAKSKFKDMPKFAKSQRGRLALQGDHGKISFRNIKIRPIEQK